MFPFRGMRNWAQAIGEVLPLPDILPQLWPIGLFTLVALVIGVKRYRQTLD